MKTIEEMHMSDSPRHKIYRNLAASSGNCGVPTDHAIRCLIGMVETGEVTIEDIRIVGGESIVVRVVEMQKESGR
jgi:hypothetical protein